MLASEYAAAESAIADVVGWYSRKYFWADPSDLEQEAWVACLRASKTFKPELGEARGYFYTAAKLALRPFVWRQRSLLSASSHDLSSLFGAMTCSLDGEKVPELVQQDGCPDAALDQARWKLAIRQRLAAVLDKIDGGKLARALLVEDQKAKAIAIAFDVPVATVYAASRRAKKAVEADCELFQLWRRDERNEN